MLRIHQLALGPMKNFIYLLQDTNSSTAAIVDPAWDATSIISLLKNLELDLTMVLLTHGHFDHVNALDALLDYRKVPVYMSDKEHASLRPSVVSHFVKDLERISLGDSELLCLQTPGHTPGGLCFIADDTYLIAGDTLFIDGCGRCDFANSDPQAMYASLQRVKSLSSDLVVYPGHDYGDEPYMTLGKQLGRNPYLMVDSLDAFLKIRM
ncbi:MAG: MBL fold metallo-hydrolase [bacterium]